ncbi:hypothetical protein LguiA_007018 [Lonicera macranthoides]
MGESWFLNHERFLTSKLVSTTKAYKCSDKRSKIVAQICARCSENLEDLSKKDLLEDLCYFRTTLYYEIIG